MTGNQAFSFNGSAAFSAAGQWRAELIEGDAWSIQADVDGDDAADLTIHMVTNDTLLAGDFRL